MKQRLNLSNLYMVILFLFIVLILLILFCVLSKKEGFEDKNIFIYWINLDRSRDRRQKMRKMLETINIPNKRITAIDGKNEKMYEMINIDNDEYNSTDSEYGCLMSHLESIRTFKDSAYRIGLILEDDCTLELKKYWDKPLEEKINEIIEKAPKDWEIIMLSYIVDNHPLNDWTNDTEFIRFGPGIYSTLSYIINKKGATKLIDNCELSSYHLSCYKDNVYTLNINSDHKSDHYIFENTITYCYKYPLFIYENEDSTIHSDHLNFHKENKERIIKNYEMNR